MSSGRAVWDSLGDASEVLSDLNDEDFEYVLIAAGIFVAATFVRFPSNSVNGYYGLVPGAVLVALVRGMSIAAVALGLLIGFVLLVGFSALSGGRYREILDLEMLLSPLLLPIAWLLWTPLIPDSGHPALVTSTAAGIVATAGVAVTWLVADLVVRAALRPTGGGGAIDRFATETRRSGPQLVMLSASASLAAMWDFSPVWAITISVGPFLVAQSLIASTVRAQAIEDLTIRALGRLPEAAGVAPTHHSSDVTDLAVEIGILMGLTAEELSTLRRAALLHDVGLLAVREAPYASLGYSEADKAKLGAEIVGESSALSSEAQLLRQVGSVYRIPGADPRTDIDHRSHIVRASCSFHTLVAAGSDSHDVVERMYRETYVHPQSVVARIRPALERLK